jgi:hypothetical protein
MAGNSAKHARSDGLTALAGISAVRAAETLQLPSFEHATCEYPIHFDAVTHLELDLTGFSRPGVRRETPELRDDEERTVPIRAAAVLSIGADDWAVLPHGCPHGSSPQPGLGERYTHGGTLIMRLPRESNPANQRTHAHGLVPEQRRERSSGVVARLPLDATPPLGSLLPVPGVADQGRTVCGHQVRRNGERALGVSSARRLPLPKQQLVAFTVLLGIISAITGAWVINAMLACL